MDLVAKPTKLCTIGDKSENCILDLGSDCSILRESFARKINLKIKPTNDALIAFNQTVVIPLGRAEAQFNLDRIKFMLDFFVVPDNSLTCDILVGRDIFKMPNLRAVTSVEGTTLEQTKTNEETKGFAVNQVVRNPEKSLRPITRKDVDCGDENSIERLLNLLNKYREIVALDNSHPLREAKVSPLKIKLLSYKVIYHRPYRLSVSDRLIVKDIVADLLDKDLASEGDSPYASPIVLVTKKNKDARMCVDYRALNKVTEKIKYPLPIPDDQIDTLKGKSVFSTIDLKSGFHQIPIHPDSKPYTSFITPDGQYIFNRVPFGLCNAPAWFQKVIRESLKGLPALNYIDDLLEATDSVEENFRELEELFERLKEHNFTINLSKCKFFKDSVTYLGREISKDGVRPGLEKILAVKNANEPTTVKQVRQLIGLISWFRRFVKNFATIVAPLTELTRKDFNWVWGPAQISAFKKIKSILIERPVLAIFDPELNTELHTDASSIGIGAMIIQIHENNLKKVVAYYSKKNSIEEQKYHSYDLETLAVYRALQYFRTYLLGIKFKVVTDCSAIRATATKKDILPRVARWWIYFQDFDFEVIYRPGVQGAHVDYLSRNPIDCLQVDITSGEWIKVAQLQDPDISIIRNIVQSGDIRPDTKQYFDSYALKGGVVFRKTPEGLRWLVPKMSRFNIVRLCHDEQGHFGVDKTLGKIKENYWFKGMKRFVAKYVNACLNCIYYKSKKGRKPGFLHSIDKEPIPFHTLHLDHIGPFVKSKKKNAFILTIVDGFTKFTFLEATRNTKTKPVVKALDQLVAIFGVPTRIICDRGTAFSSQRMAKYCEDLGIKLVLNAVSTPRANGQCEKFNDTVLNVLATTNAGQSEDMWDVSLKKVQSAMNCTVNRVTRKTPIQLLCGYKPKSSADSALIENIQACLDDADLKKMRQEAKELIDADQKRQKAYFDAKRRKAPKYNVGDIVMIPVSQKATGTSNKLKAKFRGPFKVVAELPNDRYEVQDEREMKTRGQKTVVAVDQMQRWVLFDPTEEQKW